MNRNRLRRILILLTAALLCLVMARVSYGGQRSGTGRLTLWFSLTDCPREAMESLLSACYLDTGIRVEATGYPGEEALGEAFESGRPDLLYCAQSRAALLGGGSASADFHAIGSRLPLLVVNTGLGGADYESLEALLDAAETDKPFLAGDCWADLMHAALASQGKTMYGDGAWDKKNAAFTQLYNRLAMAAFRGGLLPLENAAEYVRQGRLPCAVTLSSSLAGLRTDAVEVLPLPLPEAGETRYAAERMGFAVLEGAPPQRTEVFLHWLENGRGGETTYAAGLVPLTKGAAASHPNSALSRTLSSLATGGKLCWPDAEELFFRNRPACERSLREALDLLA